MEGLEARLGRDGRQRRASMPQAKTDQPVDHGPTPQTHADPKQTAVPVSAGYEETPVENLWQGLKGFINKKNPPLSSKVGCGEFLSYEDDCLTIGFPKDYVFMDDIKSAPQMDMLTQMAAEFLGRDITIDIKSQDSDARDPNNTVSNTAGMINNTKNEALRHPLVQKVMDVFEGAEIVDVRITGERR
ncbi:MAG: hypothetical protein U9N38_03385, partial [Thermodesulfobacteriota bacterium]|nr:hypothetical protein [Thermodesulfobacteriota bacterium]